MLIRNNGGGQPSGTTLTAANSGAGSGTAFDTVTGTPTYDNGAFLNSPNSYLFSTSTASVQAFIWGATALGGTFARLAGACYYDPSSFTVANMICRLRDGSANQIVRVITDTAGHISLRVGVGNTLVGTGSVAMVAGTVYRVEWDITVGASAPVSVTVYAGNSRTVFDTVSSATANTGTVNISTVEWGVFTSTASVPATRLGDLAVSDAAGLIGPTVPTGAPTLYSPPWPGFVVGPWNQVPVFGAPAQIVVAAPAPAQPLQGNLAPAAPAAPVRAFLAAAPAAPLIISSNGVQPLVVTPSAPAATMGRPHLLRARVDLSTPAQPLVVSPGSSSSPVPRVHHSRAPGALGVLTGPPTQPLQGNAQPGYAAWLRRPHYTARGDRASVVSPAAGGHFDSSVGAAMVNGTVGTAQSDTTITSAGMVTTSA